MLVRKAAFDHRHLSSSSTTGSGAERTSMARFHWRRFAAVLASFSSDDSSGSVSALALVVLVVSAMSAAQEHTGIRD